MAASASDSEDEFEDAATSFSWPELSESEIAGLTDEKGMSDAVDALNLCLNNHFHEAERLLGPWACWSLINSDKELMASEDAEFQAGVHFGIGSFNLMISTLPSRFVKLLQLFGFSGDKSLGIKELLHGSAMKTLRGPMCSLVYLAYNLLIVHILGTGECDLEQSEAILEECLQQYTKGAVFLYFGGRVRYIRGKIDEAIDWYSQSISAQTQWIQLHHICHWELIWCHCLKGNWRKAAEYAHGLFQASRWSKATYLYQRAAFLAMLQPLGDPLDESVVQMMKSVPKYKQRIAGKSIPVEKFAVYKSEKCLARGTKLMLPGLELVYVWNGFLSLRNSPELLSLVLVELDRAFAFSQQSDHKVLDDFCLIQLLRGVSLRDLGKLAEAEKCLTEVFSKYADLKYDHHLAPFARMELGLLYIKSGEFKKAREHLVAARTVYSKYLLESRLHFRVHSALLQIEEKD
eukprot:m.119538 g.119538  ORF g.119538 m.119538 type:complete len:461 (+) comp37699_c0_seq10:77-1459(+)